MITAFQKNAFQNNAFQIGGAPVPRGLIINGWYTDHLGGMHYYYRTPDGQPGPLPPVVI